LEPTSHPLVPVFDSHGLCLLESLHAVDFRMGWVRHSFFKVITALRGEGVFETRERGRTQSYGLTPGKVVIVSPGLSHRLRDLPGEPLLLYILCVDRTFAFPIKSPEGAGLRWVEDPHQVGRALQMLREIAILSAKGSSSKSGNPEALLRSGLAATLLGRLLCSSSDAHRSNVSMTSEARVRRFLDRLPEDFFLYRPLNEVARDLGLSRRRFTQLFQKLAGESYLQRVQRLRIDHACRLLKERKMSPVTVAFESGYEDVSSFYRAFKKFTGESPARWLDRQGACP
jgi:AraC family L-rhamnose operon regulatory protein RhaS